MTKSNGTCTTCRAPIAAGATYYRCSVSACNSGRLKMRFCSITCWETHVPTARHRKADAVEVRGDAAETPE